MTRDAIAALFSRLWERLEMAWSSIADKVTRWLDGKELLADPDFNDPSAWNVRSPPLDASVTDGSLVINSALAMSNIEPVVSSGMEFGKTYRYAIEVASTSGSGIVVFMNGVGKWGNVSGVGLFTGTFTLTETNPVPSNGYQLIINYTGGAATFNRMSIVEISTWTPDTDESTTWV